MMGGSAWLLHNAIDPALEANHRKQYAQPNTGMPATTGSISAGYDDVGYATSGGNAAGATAAAGVAIPAAAAVIVREHTGNE